MKTAFIIYDVKEAQFIPVDSKGEQCALEATEFDDACDNAIDMGYANCIYVPRKPSLVAQA